MAKRNQNKRFTRDLNNVKNGRTFNNRPKHRW